MSILSPATLKFLVIRSKGRKLLCTVHAHKTKKKATQLPVSLQDEKASFDVIENDTYPAPSVPISG